MEVYRRLRDGRGPLGWWPAETPFEVCLGAILTQNTNWTNVEKALAVLRAAGRLSFEGLAPLSAEEIAPLIRSSGVYNVKARRVRAFLDFLGREFGGRVENMAREQPAALRGKLLAIPGIGPETADCIVLYGAGLPSFVVDAYTRRVFGRLGLLKGTETYDEVQAAFHGALPREAPLFNDYHAQVVMLAKDTCRPRPLCGSCPLDGLCPSARVW